MTKKIKLTQNKFALVDNEDYERINRYKWFAHKNKRNFYADGEIRISKNERFTIRMHRLILGLKHGDGLAVDHINKNGLDNRKSNLRIASRAINMHNRRLSINNTSGFNGVSWDKMAYKWSAQIGVKGKLIKLGRYFNKSDAIEARKQGELIYWE